MTAARFTRICRLRLRSLFRASAVEDEAAAELSFHFDRLVEESLADGHTLAHSRMRARQMLGSQLHLAEACRDTRRTEWVRDCWRDMRHGARLLRQSPAFTLVAAGSLALGVGAHVALLTVIQGLFADTAMLPEASRLVVVRSVLPEGPQQNAGRLLPDYLTWRAQVPQFEATAASLADSRDLAADANGPAERITGQRFTPNMFALLGASPAAGRTFTDDEAHPGLAAPVVVISHGLWLRRFGGDPHVVGRSIVMNGVATTVVGVMPAAFRFVHDRVEYWAPLGVDATRVDGPARYHIVVGKLRAEATLSQARTALANAAAALAAERGDSARGWTLAATPLGDEFFGWAREPLFTLEAAVLLVLLIAMVNVSVLLLVRGTARARELSIRMALGAGRSRLVRQLVAENMALALAAGAPSVIVGWICIAGFSRLSPPPAGLQLSAVTFGAQTFALIVVSATVTASACGLLPALVASSGSAPRRRLDVRRVLIAIQVGVAMVLLSSAGLLFTSVLRFTQREVNIDRDHAIAFQFQPSRTPVTIDDVLRQLRALPETVSAAAISAPPVNSFVIPTVRVASSNSTERRMETRAAYFSVTPSLFETLSARLVAGRVVDDGDGAGALPAVVINESMARTLWGNLSPLGRHVAIDGEAGRVADSEVVGVIRDIPLRQIDPPSPIVYTAHAQTGAGNDRMTFVLRHRGSSTEAMDAVRRTLATLDRNSPIVNLAPMALRFGFGPRGGEQWLYASTVGLFALVATALAALGVYGVMSYVVERQTREIGIRVALGARTVQVLTAVGAGTWRAVGVGLGLGLAGALAAGRLLESQLWGTSPADTFTLGGATLILAAAGVVASGWPLRRALGVSPAAALRRE